MITQGIMATKCTLTVCYNYSLPFNAINAISFLNDDHNWSK